MNSLARDLRFLVLRTVSWWLPIGLVLMVVAMVATPSHSLWRSVWGLAEWASNRLGFTLSFVTFVTGLAAASPGRTSEPWTEVRRTIVRLLMAASLLAVVGYAIGGVASPLLEYRYHAQEGADLAARYPFGPLTPGNVVRQREAAAATSPEDYTFSINRPGDRPPNWLTFLIHSPMSLMVFALPNALIGYLFALLTVNLRPIRRRQARWAAGVGMSLVFLVPLMTLGRWVRASPENSGLLAAWLPLLAPCVMVLAAGGLVARIKAQNAPDSEGAS